MPTRVRVYRKTGSFPTLPLRWLSLSIMELWGLYKTLMDAFFWFVKGDQIIPTSATGQDLTADASLKMFSKRNRWFVRFVKSLGWKSASFGQYTRERRIRKCVQ